MNKQTQEFREKIVDDFLKSLEESPLDWKKNWKGPGGPAFNGATGRRYSGINQLALQFAAHGMGSTDPRWYTFKQASDAKLRIKKGSHGCKVEFWQLWDREEKRSITISEYTQMPQDRQEKIVWTARHYTVFNGTQIEGLAPYIAEKHDINPAEVIDHISKNMGVEILHTGGNQAFYRPKEDKVYLPLPSAFFSDYDYNATALHELAHSTGHPSRLNRPMSGQFGSEAYAKEELVAELTSCFMSIELPEVQTDEHLRNHKAYIQNWISEIKEKPETFMAAVKQAEEAAAYLENAAELTKQKGKALSAEISAAQEEVRSMNMTPEDFLEEMRAYFAGEKEAMSTDSLVYIDHESGLMQTLLPSGIKGCYWHQTGDEVATLYRLSTGEEMSTCIAGDRQEYRDRNGWHSLFPDDEGPDESDDPTYDSFTYTIDEMMRSLELDMQAGDAIPMDQTAEEHFIELLADYDQKNDTKKKPLCYENEEGATVSMQLAKTMKGCYWRSFDDGSGSLRRLEGNSTILSYDLWEAEYKDAAGWHGFERTSDWRTHLERLAGAGVVKPIDHGSTMFDVRNDMQTEELNRILEEHEKWLRGEADGRQADLSSTSLQGADLSGRNLERINLIGADLYGANLACTNLQGAKLFAADLSNADLTNANLEKVGLANATVQGANFKDANLQNTSLLDTIGFQDAQGVSQDKRKEEIAALKDQIDHRGLDKFYSDAWDQSAQIGNDIETLKGKLQDFTAMLQETDPAWHNQENTLDFMENLIQEKKNPYEENEPAFDSELER